MVRMGYEAEADRIQELFLDGKRDEAVMAVPSAFADEISLVGPPERIKERLVAWRESPVTTLLVTAREAGDAARAGGVGAVAGGRRARDLSKIRPRVPEHRLSRAGRARSRQTLAAVGGQRAGSMAADEGGEGELAVERYLVRGLVRQPGQRPCEFEDRARRRALMCTAPRTPRSEQSRRRHQRPSASVVERVPERRQSSAIGIMLCIATSMRRSTRKSARRAISSCECESHRSPSCHGESGM